MLVEDIQIGAPLSCDCHAMERMERKVLNSIPLYGSLMLTNIESRALLYHEQAIRKM
jgi:hypothetical protein